MGCDGYIENVNVPVVLNMLCNKCGWELFLDNPKADHEKCAEDDRLRVLVQITNYESR